jgi:hypothetical protein
MSLTLCELYKLKRVKFLTIDQIKNLNTKRLLTYYKKIRYLLKYYNENIMKAQQAYANAVKSELNQREHVFKNN